MRTALTIARRELADRYRGARWAPLRVGLRAALGVRSRWSTRHAS